MGVNGEQGVLQKVTVVGDEAYGGCGNPRTCQCGQSDESGDVIDRVVPVPVGCPLRLR
jgi:hypothetical protein